MYNDFNWNEYEVDEYYQPTEKIMLNHNLKMVLGFAFVFVVGGLQAFHGLGGWSVYADMLVSLLLTGEHLLNGNMN